MPFELEIYINTDPPTTVIKRFSTKAVADVELDKIIRMGCREIDADLVSTYRIWPAHKIDHIIVKEV